MQAIHSAKKLHTRPELAESIEVKHLYGTRLVLCHKYLPFFRVEIKQCWCRFPFWEIADYRRKQSFVIIFSLFGSEFQKYALSSLQQLLADHPPAPEGLDPDTGTAPSILT